MSAIWSRDAVPQQTPPVPAAFAHHRRDVDLLHPQHVGPGAEVCNGQQPALLWIAHGAIELEWRLRPGEWRPLHLHAGDFYVNASRAVQLRRASGCQLAFEGIRLDISRQILTRCSGDHNGAATPLPVHEMAGNADPTMRALLELLHASHFQAIAPPRPFVEGLTQAVVAQLASYPARTNDQGNPHHGLPPYKFRLVSCAMRDRLTEPFDLERLAQLAGLSTFHFSRSFKKASGMAPSRYFQRLRVEQAKRMLSSIDQPIIDIAMAVGFRTPSHFAQVFRETVGMSPSEYRNRLVSPPGACYN